MLETKPEVAVTFIWVHFKTPQLLLKSITAVLNDCSSQSFECQIIVVNNGGSLNEISVFSDCVQVIDQPHNPGYAAAINVGVAHAVASKIIVLNPDVIIQPQCVSSLLNSIDQETIVAPRLYLDDGLLFKLPLNERYGFSDQILRQFAKRYPTIQKTARQRWRAHARPHKCNANSFNLSGACLGFSREAWETIGPWDESFFLYFEETDWLIRAKQHSIRGQVVSEAVAIHYVSQSPLKPEQQAAVFQQSLRHFKRKHLNRIERMVLRFVERIASTKVDGPKQQRLDKQLTENKPSLSLLLKSGQTLEISNRSEGFPAAICSLSTLEVIDSVLVDLRTAPLANCHICLLDRDKNELIPPTPLDQFSF